MALIFKDGVPENTHPLNLVTGSGEETAGTRADVGELIGIFEGLLREAREELS